jgi:CheY-like chemotaxis protein
MNLAQRLQKLLNENKTRLLVVEDDPLVLDSMLDLLDSSKLDIKVAKSWKEAEHALNSQTFDKVITDLNFPTDGGKPQLNGDKVADLAHQKGIKSIVLHSADPEDAKSKNYTDQIKKMDYKYLRKVD